MSLNINGRMKVKTLKSDFKKEFGLTIRVYDGRSFADDGSTLASIRSGDSKGGEFSPKRNTKIGNLEDKIMELFGLKTQIAGSDDSYLCDNDYTLAKALEVDDELMDKRSSKKSDTKEEKPKATESISKTTMSFTDIIEEIKNTYSNHEDFEDMMNDLENDDDYIAYWANKLCRDEFNKNMTLSKSLFEIAEEKIEYFDDLMELGDYIADSYGFNDKAWARKIYQKASNIAETSDDFVKLADSGIARTLLDDKIWAKEQLNIALEKAEEPRDFEFIAGSASMIDENWAQEIREMQGA